MQLLAYHIVVRKGLDVDILKILMKSVTVEHGIYHLVLAIMCNILCKFFIITCL